MKTLQELLVPQTDAEVAQSILDNLATQTPPLPTTTWDSGSVPSTLISVFADSEANLYTGRINVASGGYLGLATGDWLTLLAYQNYGVERDLATSTRGLVQITDAGGGPHTVTAGTTTVSNGTRTYKATAGATVPLNASIFVPVQANVAGSAGNVPNGTITTLVTALAGATVSNVIPWITVVGTASVKTQGYVNLTSVGGGSVTSGTVVVEDALGHQYTNVNNLVLLAATAQQVLVEALVVGAASNVGNGAITIVSADPLLDITVANPAPASGVTNWITTAGSDEQTDASLTTECQNVLLARGIAWTASGIEYLVSQAPISSGSDITRTLVVSNPGGIAGKIGVYIANAAGPVSGPDVADVQTYLDENRALCSTIEVLSASALTITITGTASAPSAYLATAQAAAAANLTALAANTPIGGSAESGYAVQLEDILSAIKSASYDSSGNQTNPAAATQIALSSPTGDVALTSTQIPSFTVSLTWSAV